jgi:hypothetical protein
MKYKKQDHQIINTEYSFTTHIWTLQVPNNIIGLNEALQKIKKAKKQLMVGVRRVIYKRTRKYTINSKFFNT